MQGTVLSYNEDDAQELFQVKLVKMQLLRCKICKKHVG